MTAVPRTRGNLDTDPHGGEGHMEMEADGGQGAAFTARGVRAGQQGPGV